MYPLDVILIGCGDDVAPHLRRELLNNGATVSWSFRMFRRLSKPYDCQRVSDEC